MPWSKAAALWGVVCVAAIGMTHLFRLCVRRWGWLSLPPVAFLARVSAATLLITTLSYLLVMTLSMALHDTPVAPIASAFYQKLSTAGQLRNLYIIILVMHAAWVAVYLTFAMQRHRYDAELHQAQLGKALQAAELRLLKSQLNPHFLFNSLNGLRSLIADEPARARDAVTQLARMLRYTLAASGEDLVTLDRELEMVDDYLSLESMRLADRLTIEREIQPAARAVRVPAMLLQTLVENALKHGIAELQRGGTLTLRAFVKDQQLTLQVENPRPLEPAPPSADGVGLRNATERLRLLFGERASLKLDLSVPGRSSAEVRLPA